MEEEMKNEIGRGGKRLEVRRKDWRVKKRGLVEGLVGGLVGGLVERLVGGGVGGGIDGGVGEGGRGCWVVEAWKRQRTRGTRDAITNTVCTP